MSGRFLKYDPELARALGTRGALVVELVRFRGQLAEPGRDGERWVAITYREMLSEWFPDVGETALRSTVDALRGRGVLKRRRALPSERPRAVLYALDYGALAKVAPESSIAKEWARRLDEAEDAVGGRGGRPPVSGGEPSASASRRARPPEAEPGYLGNRGNLPSESEGSYTNVRKNNFEKENETFRE